MTNIRKNGRVKWFNVSRGYGFIVNVEDNSKDIFVHYSNININDNNVFKTLYEGEYISYIEYTDEKKRSCASKIMGIGEGPLLCESKHQNKNKTTD